MTDSLSVCYSAPCPSCAADVEWRTTAGGPDLDRTRVDYEIDCMGCGEAEAVVMPPVPAHRPSVSSLAWLGRSA